MLKQKIFFNQIRKCLQIKQNWCLNWILFQFDILAVKVYIKVILKELPNLKKNYTHFIKKKEKRLQKSNLGNWSL